MIIVETGKRRNWNLLGCFPLHLLINLIEPIKTCNRNLWDVYRGTFENELPQGKCLQLPIKLPAMGQRRNVARETTQKILQKNNDFPSFYIVHEVYNFALRDWNARTTSSGVFSLHLYVIYLNDPINIYNKKALGYRLP